MPPVIVHTTRPTLPPGLGGPTIEGTDRDNHASPPGSVLLPGTNGLLLRIHVAAGTAAVMPHYWNGLAWVGLGGDADAAVGPAPTTADSGTRAGWSEGRYVNSGESRYWCAVRESGAGTVDNCELSAVTR